MAEATTDLPVQPPPDPHAEVSIEVDGRVLTGVGVTADSLEHAVDGTTPGKVPDEAPPADTPPEKLTRGQRRFLKLTSERDAERQRAEQAARDAESVKAERDRLLAELDALKRQATVQPPAQPMPRSEPVREADLPPTSGLRARPSVNEIGTTYADWDAYQTDDTKWVQEQIAAVRADVQAQIRAAIEQDRAHYAWQSRVAQIKTEGAKLYPDFDQVIGSLKVEFNRPTLEAIVSSPDSPRLQYALAQKPAEAASIAAMTNPIEIGLALASLLQTASPVASPASTGAGRVSQAPPPVQPVGSGSRTTNPPLTELADKGDFEAYKARRHSELREVSHR